jgi:hypothetical protein
MFFDNAIVEEKPDAQESSVSTGSKVPLDEDNRECRICKERFEVIWDEDEEEWIMKNAIKIGEKVYHEACYNESSFV